jgi:hypothetical protein
MIASPRSLCARLSRHYSLIVSARLFAPLGKSYFAPIALCYVAVASSVVCLLLKGCPSAIFWTVVSVYIYSIYRVLLRWGSVHVPQEPLVTLKPLCTHFDSSSAIVRIGPIGLCVAACLHLKPRSVFLRASVPFAVSLLTRSASFFSQASTALCIAVLKCTAVSNDPIPALAHAVPPQESSALTVGSLPHYDQAREFFPGQINLFHRRPLYAI